MAEAERAARVSLPLVKVVGVGGTIAMRYDPVREGYVPAVTEEELLALVPGLEAVARVESEQFSNVPSDYMSPEIWLELSAFVNRELERPEIHGLVLTHGTDTLEETVFFLDRTTLSDKPVACTGAQRTISEPDFDGPRNLGDSIKVAADPRSRGLGVMVVFDGKMFAPEWVYKCHTTRVDGFSGGEAGLLGDVYLGRVRYVGHSESLYPRFDVRGKTSLPRVEVFHMYPGADPDLVRGCADRGCEGLVVQAFGAGNLSDGVFRAIKDLIARGVEVVISTVVPAGGVVPLYGFDGGGQTLKAAGARSAGLLTTNKARILLMLCLASDQRAERLRTCFAW